MARANEGGREANVGRGAFGEEPWRQRAREELVGIREAAAVLGRTDQRVRELEKERSGGERDDFPEPVLRLASGPLWAREDLRRFGAQGLGRRSGPELVTLYGLRRVRKEKGFDRQQRLAAESGVSVPTISQAERGGRSRRTTAQKIAAALGVTVEELEGW